MRFDWLHGIRQSLFGPPAAPARDRPLSVGIGYCPGCDGLRATNSPTCSQCGSAAPVPADA